MKKKTKNLGKKTGGLPPPFFFFLFFWGPFFLTPNKGVPKQTPWKKKNAPPKAFLFWVGERLGKRKKKKSKMGFKKAGFPF